MTVSVQPIAVFTDNYVWAISDHARAVVVDPGDAVPVAGWLRERGLELAAILITHHHPDHIGGLPELRRHWPAAIVHGPDDARIDGVDHAVGDGDRIEIAAPGLAFDVVTIPGHTLSHIAFHGEGLLFSGDTLFSAGCGRLFEGSPAQMLDSLDHLAALPDDTRVCCGHEYTAGNCDFAIHVEPDNDELRRYRERVRQLRERDAPTLPSSIGLERSVNPFLRVDQPGVRAWLHAHADLPDSASRVEAFAALRRAKDGFRG